MMNSYEEGWGEQEAPAKVADVPQDDPFEFARKEAEERFDAPVQMPEAEPVAVVVKPALDPKPETPLSFKETFALHRKSGAKTFEWNGKKYTTNLKGDTKPAVPQLSTKPARAPGEDSQAEWSVVRKDNRPTVAVAGKSGSMKMPAAEKGYVDGVPSMVSTDMLTDNKGPTYFNSDGTVANKQKPAAAPVPPATKVVRTSSPMRG